MKRFIFSFLLLIGALTSISVFYACSSDEADDQSLSQSQLLLKKSREFAKKYGVELALNEENIDEIAKTLTVEQMEKDYQEWANTNIHLSLIQKNNLSTKTINKLRINKRRTTFESTSLTQHCEFNADNNKNIYVTLDYNFGNQGSGLAHVSISYKGSNGEKSFIPIGFTLYDTGEYTFIILGSIYLTGPVYSGMYRIEIERKINGEIYCTVTNK